MLGVVRGNGETPGPGVAGGEVGAPMGGGGGEGPPVMGGSCLEVRVAPRRTVVFIPLLEDSSSALTKLATVPEFSPKLWGHTKIISRQCGEYSATKLSLQFQMLNSTIWTANSLGNVPELSPKCRNSDVHSRRNVPQL